VISYPGSHFCSKGQRPLAETMLIGVPSKSTVAVAPPVSVPRCSVAGLWMQWILPKIEAQPDVSTGPVSVTVPLWTPSI